MAGEVVEVDESTESEIAVDGMGSGTFVARNMWYVCREARMKRHERGMTGRPSRRVRF